MENWLTFLLVNVVLVIFLQIFYDLAKSWVESSYQRSILSSNKKKIEELKREYSKKKLLYEHPSLLTPFAIKDFVQNLMAYIVSLALSLIMFSVAAYYFFESNTWRLYLFVVFLANNAYTAFTTFRSTIRLIDDSLTFPNYKVQAEQKIKKLGGNPEDLDKEEE